MRFLRLSTALNAVFVAPISVPMPRVTVLRPLPANRSEIGEAAGEAMHILAERADLGRQLHDRLLPAFPLLERARRRFREHLALMAGDKIRERGRRVVELRLGHRELIGLPLRERQLLLPGELRPEPGLRASSANFGQRRIGGSDRRGIACRRRLSKTWLGC